MHRARSRYTSVCQTQQCGSLRWGVYGVNLSYGKTLWRQAQMCTCTHPQRCNTNWKHTDNATPCVPFTQAGSVCRALVSAAVMSFQNTNTRARIVLSASSKGTELSHSARLSSPLSCPAPLRPGGCVKAPGSHLPTVLLHRSGRGPLR